MKTTLQEKKKKSEINVQAKHEKQVPGLLFRPILDQGVHSIALKMSQGKCSLASTSSSLGS